MILKSAQLVELLLAARLLASEYVIQAFGPSVPVVRDQVFSLLYSRLWCRIVLLNHLSQNRHAGHRFHLFDLFCVWGKILLVNSRIKQRKLAHSGRLRGNNILPILINVALLRYLRRLPLLHLSSEFDVDDCISQDILHFICGEISWPWVAWYRRIEHWSYGCDCGETGCTNFDITVYLNNIGRCCLLQTLLCQKLLKVLNHLKVEL